MNKFTRLVIDSLLTLLLLSLLVLPISSLGLLNPKTTRSFQTKAQVLSKQNVRKDPPMIPEIFRQTSESTQTTKSAK